MTSNINDIDMAQMANPTGAFNSGTNQGVSIQRCQIEYLMREKNIDNAVKGHFTFSNSEGPVRQSKQFKTNWLSTRVVRKYGSDYGQAPETYCSSIDSFNPDERKDALGNDARISPLCARIVDGKPEIVCDEARWRVKCPTNPNHVEPFARLRKCPTCQRDLKRVPPNCKEVKIGLFWLPKEREFFSFWFWKTSEKVLDKLYALMSQKGPSRYGVPASHIPYGIEVTMISTAVKTYFTPAFPEILPDGADGWRPLTEDQREELKAIALPAIRIFNQINFFKTEEKDDKRTERASTESDDDGREEGQRAIPF